MQLELPGRVQAVFEALREGLVERDEPLWLALLAALSGEHFLLVGPPGTAKSTLARRLHLAFPGRYFERLLTRFTVPEEIFGPLSLKGLERDVYERLTEGYLPTATVAFLDEIFKANSAILNALLGVLNERVVDQGPRRDAVPLVCLIGASNELPDTDELAALSDRFILRYEVRAVSREGFGSLLATDDVTAPLPPELRFDAEDLTTVRRAARAVIVPRWVQDLAADLRAILDKQSIYVSDRRWRKAFDVLRTAAFLDGRDAVGLSEVALLRHILWQRPQQRDAIEAAIRAAMVESFLAEPERHLALVETLEKTLDDEVSAVTHLQDQSGALYIGPNGDETNAPVSRRHRTNSSGEQLYAPPPGSQRFACTANDLRERFDDRELERYIGNPANWVMNEMPNEPRIGPKRYPTDHISARIEQVARVRQHVREFVTGLEKVVTPGEATDDAAREIAAARARLEDVARRLDALHVGFEALPRHSEDDEDAMP
jgi:MoxR-like ATPase